MITIYSKLKWQRGVRIAIDEIVGDIESNN